MTDRVPAWLEGRLVGRSAEGGMELLCPFRPACCPAGLLRYTWAWYACAGVSPARVSASRLESIGSIERDAATAAGAPTRDLAREWMAGGVSVL